jgi:type IV pilus assembly protein PilW
MRERRRRQGGFTLVEMLTGAAVSSIILLAVGAMAIGQSRAFEASVATKDAVSNGRSGLTFLETKLRNAGYGVDPRFTFDFGTTGTSITRDYKDRPDELAFYSRDPEFARRATLNNATLTLTENSVAQPLTAVLFRGQILQLLCASGTGAYVTVKTTTAATAGTIEIFDAAGTPAFPREAIPACLTSATTGSELFVVKVDRYRFFVAEIEETAGNLRRYLLLDRGLDLSGSRTYDDTRLRLEEETDNATDGTKFAPGSLSNFVPVASDIEDFQVAYVMNQPQAAWGVTPAPAEPDLGNKNWILGDDSTASAEQPSAAATAPRFETAYRDANRFTKHPANVRAVRISLLARAPQSRGTGSRPALENRSAGARDGFYRNLMRSQVAPQNILTRSSFVPPHNVNKWGG